MDRIELVTRHLIETIRFAMRAGHSVYVWYSTAESMEQWCRETLPADRWRIVKREGLSCIAFMFRHRTDQVMFCLRWSESLALNRAYVEREVWHWQNRRVDDGKFSLMVMATLAATIFVGIAILNLVFDIAMWIVR